MAGGSSDHNTRAPLSRGPACVRRRGAAPRRRCWARNHRFLAPCSRTAVHGSACTRPFHGSRSWRLPARPSVTTPSRPPGCSASSRHSTALVIVPQSRPQIATRARLNGAVQVMADIAVHVGAAFDRLARAGILHIPARTLPRDLVTDRPEIAAARLGGRTAPAPNEVVTAVAAMYAEAAAHPNAFVRPFRLGPAGSSRRPCRCKSEDLGSISTNGRLLSDGDSAAPLVPNIAQTMRHSTEN